MDTMFPKELLSYCRVMGVFPVKNISYGRIDKLKFSAVTLIYSLALVATQVGMSFYSLFWFCDEFVRATSIKCNKKTAVFVVFCNIIFLTVAVLILVISSIRGCRCLIELYQTLERIDSALKTEVEQSHMKYWLIITVTCLIVLIAVEFGVILMMGLAPPAYLMVLTLHCTVLAVQLKFLSVVDGIRSRFSLLNYKISEEITRHRFKGLNKLTISTAVPLVVEELVGTKMCCTVQPMSVQSLSDLHWALCDMIHKTNAIFGWQLLALMMLLFYQIIVTPYQIFYAMSLYVRGHQSSMFLLHLAVQVLWMLIHLSKIILLIWPCSMTMKEANKTAPIICKLLNKEMSPYMKKQLEIFLLQLLHHNAEFSVFGLFNLQCPILTSIAGAVTTYLVILIQFQNCDRDDTN